MRGTSARILAPWRERKTRRRGISCRLGRDWLCSSMTTSPKIWRGKLLTTKDTKDTKFNRARTGRTDESGETPPHVGAYNRVSRGRGNESRTSPRHLSAHKL